MSEEATRDKFLREIMSSFQISKKLEEVFVELFTYTSDDEYEKRTISVIAQKLNIGIRTVTSYSSEIYQLLSKKSEKFGEFEVISRNERGPAKRGKIYSYMWSILYPKWCEMCGENLSSLEKVGLLSCHIQSTDIFPLIGNSILEAKKEIWFFGTNFRISLPDYQDMIIGKILEDNSFAVYFLVFNYNNDRLAELADDFSQTEQELRRECVDGLKSLLSLKNKLVNDSKNSSMTNQISIRLSNSFPRMRAYIFDPNEQKQYSIFIPYINAVDSPYLPAYLCKNVNDGISKAYFAGIKREWSRSISIEQARLSFND